MSYNKVNIKLNTFLEGSLLICKLPSSRFKDKIALKYFYKKNFIKYPPECTINNIKGDDLI